MLGAAAAGGLMSINTAMALLIVQALVIALMAVERGRAIGRVAGMSWDAGFKKGHSRKCGPYCGACAFIAHTEKKGNAL